MPPWTPTAWPPRTATCTGNTSTTCTRTARRSTAQDRDLNKSYAALDRIARQDEATLAKLDTAKLDACIAKQDETQVKASAKEADRWALKARRPCSSMANASTARFPKEQLWMVIDRALRAAGEQPPPPRRQTRACNPAGGKPALPAHPGN